MTIANNTIGAISVAGTKTPIEVFNVSHAFVGIATTGAGNATITGNTVGSLTTADSIQAAFANSASYGQYVRGIESNSSGTVVITGNTVANLRNAYGGVASGGQTAGIRTTAGANTITGNTVRNLTSNGNTQDTTHNAALVGIAQAATTAGDQIVAQNVVYALSSEPATSNTIHPYGIYFRAPATATNLVSRNFVHSISIGGSNAYAFGVVTGIYGGGTGTYQNNVVRLGVDATGAAITRNYTFYGIQQAAAASFYFNSVYIGGGPVAPNAYYHPTYAFYSSYDALTLQNNLLVNARVNSSSGPEQHNAAFFATTTGLTSDYNVFLACGAGGMLIRESYTDYTLDAWQTASGQDGHSFSPTALGQVGFVNATGDAASVDLRVQSPTVAEAAGVDIPTVTDDYAGQTRAGLTPVDLGAYAGNWGSVSAPPAISYTALPTTTTDLTGPTLSNVFVSAAAGVASVPGTRPRLYFKRGTDADTFNDNTPASDGWKWVEASGSGGSPFDFTLDYGLLYGGSVSGGVQIQ
ncbi:MAG: hypothetical protein NT169_21620 [Chloroflexi bacterium]|nr:hypothetical protein [Chloroflexota bacterium]